MSTHVMLLLVSLLKLLENRILFFGGECHILTNFRREVLFDDIYW